jgi:hypothetical protein
VGLQTERRCDHIILMACYVNLSIFPSQILLVLEIVIGVQFYGHAVDNFLQESPTDEDMEDNDEGYHDWSDGEQDGKQRVVISVFPHVISVPILITFYPLLRC